MNGAPTAADRLGAALRHARKRAGLTQAELGEFAGIDRFAVAAIERGHATTQLRRLFALLDAVGLDLVVTPLSCRLATAGDDGHADP